jgi:hypothetical protein
MDQRSTASCTGIIRSSTIGQHKHNNLLIRHTRTTLSSSRLIDDACAGNSDDQPVDEQQAEQQAQKQQRVQQAAIRKLLRHLVMQHSSIPEWDESPAPTKLHLLVQAAEGQQPQPSFMPKRGLSINTRKGFQVRMFSTSLPRQR